MVGILYSSINWQVSLTYDVVFNLGYDVVYLFIRIGGLLYTIKLILLEFNGFKIE